MKEILKTLKEDKYICDIFKDNIWFFNYPEVGKVRTPYIVIDEIDDPIPIKHGSNERIVYSHLIQIDVFVPSSRSYRAYDVCKESSLYISELLFKKLNIKNTSSSKPEFSEEYQIHRRARRYEKASFLMEE